MSTEKYATYFPLPKQFLSLNLMMMMMMMMTTTMMMIASIQRYSPLSSRVTALACGAT